MFHLHQMRVQCALLLHANVPRPIPHLDMHVCVCVYAWAWAWAWCSPTHNVRVADDPFGCQSNFLIVRLVTRTDCNS